ncbi:MAG TPA: alpha-(1-_3)-arabinofuranosyltransferase family protein [Acidimicrobiia bacterium]
MTKLAEPAGSARVLERGRQRAGGHAEPRRWDLLGILGFALLVYLPVLLTSPGRVEGDTKAYLYLDPGRLLQRATSIWDPSIAMGTLSHQQIGYLFPMGPFYWLTETALGLPAWVAQRIWLGTLLFLAGLGVRYLLRTLGLRGWGVGVAVLAYTFTPYALGYAGFTSMLLGPWVALPWWIAIAARALRRGGWYYPALFALSVQLVGSLNGSALFFGLVGPALWVLFAVIVVKESTWGRAWAATWRTGLLTLLTSLWWLGPLVIEGKYGLNILRFTESVQTVSATSYPYEVLRGLGYWFFYGADAVTRWTSAVVTYTTRVPILLISFAVPALALIGAALLRWRYRAFFVLLILVGFAMAVGAEPYSNPSLAGGLYKSFALSSNVGFALRNTARAIPLLALGLAVLVGVAANGLISWLSSRSLRPLGVGVAVVIMGIVLANAAPALSGAYYQSYLERSDQIPKYWQQAIAALNAGSHNTRVLALPGSDFASYRWGDTRDPIEPGLMDRPYVARELVPWGSAQSANLLQALDGAASSPDASGVASPDVVAPVARLMGVGDVELRMDLQTDKWGLIPATSLWRSFTQRQPTGLGTPTTYGKKIPGSLKLHPLPELAVPGGEPVKPPPVAVFPVQHALPIVRTKSATTPVVVDGDGVGLVDMAAARSLDAGDLMIYSPTYQTDPKYLRALPSSAALVITDTNRRRGLRWTGLQNNFGYTEQAGEKPLVSDPTDQRLDLFPGSTDTSKSVEILTGAKSVQATDYGTAGLSYEPDFRPTRAFDDDPKTAWAVAGGQAVGHEKLRITFDHPITTDHINLMQYGTVPAPGQKFRRFISQVGLRFNSDSSVTRALGKPSRTLAGQAVTFPRRTFKTLELTIDRVAGRTTNIAVQKNPVGFSEIRVADNRPGAQPVHVTETTELPRDLLHALGARSASHPLEILLSRDLTMDEASMNREFTVPTARSFVFSGTAAMSANAHDDTLDRALGLPNVAEGGVTATSGDNYGDVRARASAALDGNPRTAWTTPLNKPEQTMTVQVGHPITFDRLNLQVVADGHHSLPTQLRITSDNGATRVVNAPPLPLRSPSNTFVSPVQFAPLTGNTFSVAITQFTRLGLQGATAPVGIAELGIPGVRVAAPPAQLPATCTYGLVTVDGKPFGVRVSGTTADALRGLPVSLSACDSAQLLDLGPGSHQVRTMMEPRNDTGFDVRQIKLSSTPQHEGTATLTAAATAPSPKVKVVKQGRASMTLSVAASSKPYWLVLGQSFNSGWSAKIDGHDLGAPKLVDGYANGWRIPASEAHSASTVTLTWTPQQTVWKLILVSVGAVLLCLGLVLFALIRRRRPELAGANADAGSVAATPPSLSPTPDALAPSTAGTVVAVASSGLIAALLIHPWVGVLVAAFVFAATRNRWVRTALRFAPAVIVIGVAFGITATQALHHYPPRFDWPTNFSAASTPTWTAIALLVGDAIIEATWRRARKR